MSVEWYAMKNLFAIVGFIVIARKALDLYFEYSALKREKNAREAAQQH